MRFRKIINFVQMKILNQESSDFSPLLVPTSPLFYPLLRLPPRRKQKIRQHQGQVAVLPQLTPGVWPFLGLGNRGNAGNK